MRITFTEKAWNELLELTQERRQLKRLTLILADIQRGRHSGLGKPERLSGDLAGFWSRRIDDRHRLVYTIEDESIIVYQCQGHYQD
ncbi:MAG: Txe/YoeB family addiction module toxin [Propionibacteriaceae bacterium]|nr:Txe/YoeB family addiction module toxin [Propionibacteriaceae bacterium]